MVEHASGVAVPSADSATQTRKRVLIVDDSATVVKIIKKGIESMGYEVYTAGDGVEALEIINEIPLNLVLTDINMPNMDGYELIVRIRAESRFAILPIIVLTSVLDKSVMRKALDAGANIFLTKPAPMPKLRYKVQSLLGDASIAVQEEKVEKAVQKPDVVRAVDDGEKELERKKRALALSADMHIEMYLYADTDEEAEDWLLSFDHRTDMDSGQVLPLLLDDTLGKDQMIRLFKLMAHLTYEEFVIPLLHRFNQVNDVDIQREIIWAIGSCGKREFLPELRQLHTRLLDSTRNFNSDQVQILDTFGTVIDAIDQNKNTMVLRREIEK